MIDLLGSLLILRLGFDLYNFSFLFWGINSHFFDYLELLFHNRFAYLIGHLRDEIVVPGGFLGCQLWRRWGSISLTRRFFLDTYSDLVGLNLAFL